MGRRGPAPLPTAVKRLRGEDHLKRLNAVEPVPRAGEPVMPADLTDEAVVVWRRLLDAAPRGMVTRFDGPMFRAWVEAIVEYERNVALYQASSPVLRSKRADGPGLVRNPLTQVVRDSRDQVRLFAREFGASPSARANLHADSAPEVEALWTDVGVPRRLAVVGRGK